MKLAKEKKSLRACMPKTIINILEFPRIWCEIGPGGVVVKPWSALFLPFWIVLITILSILLFRFLS
jgi:hypothetical protein